MVRRCTPEIMFCCVFFTTLMSLVSSANAFQTANSPRPTFKPNTAYFFTTNQELADFFNEFNFTSEEEENNQTNADADSNNYISSQPVEFGTPEYNDHIQNLILVNGVKSRNLYLRSTKNSNPYVYFTNPIEARFPHPFAPVRAMKQVLWERIQLQKDILDEINRDKLAYVPNLNMKKNRVLPENTRRSYGEASEENYNRRRRNRRVREKTPVHVKMSADRFNAQERSQAPAPQAMTPILQAQMSLHKKWEEQLKKAQKIDREDPVVLMVYD